MDGVYARNKTGAVAVPVNHAFGSTLRRQVVVMNVVILQRLRQRLEDINRNFARNISKLDQDWSICLWKTAESTSQFFHVAVTSKSCSVHDPKVIVDQCRDVSGCDVLVTWTIR